MNYFAVNGKEKLSVHYYKVYELLLIFNIAY